MAATGQQYTTVFTASTAGGVVTFYDNNSTGIAVNATYVRIENTGSSDGFYVRLGSTTATTSDWRIIAGSSAGRWGILSNFVNFCNPGSAMLVIG